MSRTLNSFERDRSNHEPDIQGQTRLVISSRIINVHIVLLHFLPMSTTTWLFIKRYKIRIRITFAELREQYRLSCNIMLRWNAPVSDYPWRRMRLYGYVVTRIVLVRKVSSSFVFVYFHVPSSFDILSSSTSAKKKIYRMRIARLTFGGTIRNVSILWSAKYCSRWLPNPGSTSNLSPK